MDVWVFRRWANLFCVSLGVSLAYHTKCSCGVRPCSAFRKRHTAHTPESLVVDGKTRVTAA
jgi:hypothetical protein